MEENRPIIIEEKGSELLPKILTALLGIIIIVELYLGFKAFSSQNIVSGNKLQSLTSGEIAMVADKSSYNVGDRVDVIVRISTGGHNIVGSDLDISYDPKSLEATSSAFFKGRVFDQYPVISFTPGNIKVSGIISTPNKGFTGVGVFGGIVFTAKAAGKTNVTLNFTPGSTTRSTITESITARNILGQIKNVSINIGQTGQPVNSTCSPRIYQTCRDNFGRIGTQWCTNLSDNPNTCSSGCFQDETSFIPGCKVTTVK